MGSQRRLLLAHAVLSVNRYAGLRLEYDASSVLARAVGALLGRDDVLLERFDLGVELGLDGQALLLCSLQRAVAVAGKRGLALEGLRVELVDDGLVLRLLRGQSGLLIAPRFGARVLDKALGFLDDARRGLLRGAALGLERTLRLLERRGSGSGRGAAHGRVLLAVQALLKCLALLGLSRDLLGAAAQQALAVLGLLGEARAQRLTSLVNLGARLLQRRIEALRLSLMARLCLAELLGPLHLGLAEKAGLRRDLPVGRLRELRELRAKLLTCARDGSLRGLGRLRLPLLARARHGHLNGAHGLLLGGLQARLHLLLRLCAHAEDLGLGGRAHLVKG